MKPEPLHARGPDSPCHEPLLDLFTAEPTVTARGGTAFGGHEESAFADDELAPASLVPDRVNSLESGAAPDCCAELGIEIRPSTAGLFSARFALLLASVASAALTPDRARWDESGTIDPCEAARQRAFASLACSLRASQCVRFVHATVEQDDGALRYRMLIEGEVLAPSTASASALARELYQSLRTCLAVGASQFGFEALDRPPAPAQWLDEVALIPAAIGIQLQAAVAFGAAPGTGTPHMFLPIVPKHCQTYLDGIVAALLSQRGPAQVVIEWTSLQIDASSRDAIQHEVCSLLDRSAGSLRYAGHDGRGVEVPTEDVQLTHRALQTWIAEPLGASMQVRLQSSAMVTPSLGRMMGRELFLGRPFSQRRTLRAIEQSKHGNPTAFDLRSLVTAAIPLPPLLPNPSSADAQGLARQFPDIDFARSRKGILLGYSINRGLEIRFADRDRQQHCLVLGNSGSGKTRGVIEAMILQDMARGESVFFPDFTGDSVDYLHAACPPQCRKNIVSLDFTNFDASPGLNLLQFHTRWPKVERGFIVDNLVQMFRAEYPDTPEGFGPMFELYLTNAAYLVMEEKGSTVADIVRVFADPFYRRRLVTICKDSAVAEFWRNIAARAGGEASLENIAPYIVSKLVKMVYDHSVLPVVGQQESTIDFRAGIDSGRVYLLNLSKGALGLRGARFLAMLATSRLFAAALSRTDVAPHLRPPCNVYLDEFQNLIVSQGSQRSDIEGMLAESRKWGLRLVLSTQNLSQLPQGLSETVLTNCGTKVLMRCGPHDAALLAPWVKPHFSEADLAALPNRHAVVRVMTNGVLSPPFAMRTRTLPERDRSPETDALVAAIRAESKARYCVDAQTIEARIAARRAENSEHPKAVAPKEQTQNPIV